MKKLSIFLLLQLSPKHSYQRPSAEENIEGILDITQDRVNIDEGVSYPQGINSTHMKTASVLDNFSTRFAKRPTPKPVAEPISATNSDKPATDPRDIDSILGLLRDNIALPLPQNVRVIETTIRFPFIDWQDKESVSNTRRFKDDNLINTNLPIEDNLDRFSRPSKESSDGLNPTNSKETSSDSESFKQERSFGQIKGQVHGGQVSKFPYELLENNDNENTDTSELRISINKEDELQATERINESSKKQGSGLFKQESRFDHVEGKFGQGDVSAFSGRTEESGILNNIVEYVEAFTESIFEEDGSGEGINNDNELTDAPNATDDLEANAKIDKLNERQPKSSESENNKEENSQHDESLGTAENTLNHILTRKLKIESSDDNLEYIFEGNSDASNEIEDEIDEPIKTANLKDDKGLCGHLQTESERVRCKVIACFGDNETCYNK